MSSRSLFLMYSSTDSTVNLLISDQDVMECFGPNILFFLLSIFLLILYFFFFWDNEEGTWQGSHMTGHMMWRHKPRTW